MKKHVRGIILSLAIVTFVITMCIPVHLNAQILPPYPYYNPVAASPLVPFIPPLPLYNPYYAYGYGLVPSPALIPPAPVVRSAAATITLILPTATLVPATVPVAPAPLISTTQLFLGLLLTGGESGLFYTNPALFWYIVGILY